MRKILVIKTQSSPLKLFSTKIKTIYQDISGNIPIEVLWSVIQKNKNEIFKDYSQVVAVYVSKYVKKPRANCITFFNKEDFYDEEK